MTDERQPKGISRRTVAKGAAWAIPAIPLVVAAPAYAASPDCLTLEVTGCREVGNAIKEYEIVICNSCYSVEITGLFSNAKELYTDQALTTSYNETLPQSPPCTTVLLYSGAAATWVYAEYIHNGAPATSGQFQTGPHSCV